MKIYRRTLPPTTVKYFSDQRKHRYELSDKSKTQSTEFLFARN